MALQVSQLKAMEMTEAKLKKEETDMMTRLNAFVSCYRKIAKIFLRGNWM